MDTPLPAGADDVAPGDDSLSPPANTEKQPVGQQAHSPAPANASRDIGTTASFTLALVALIAACSLSYVYRTAAAKSLRDGANFPRHIYVDENPVIPLGFSRLSLNPDPFVGRLAQSLAGSHFNFDLDPKLYDEKPSPMLALLQSHDERVAKLLSGKIYSDIFDLLDEKLLRGELSEFELLLRIYATRAKSDIDEFESYLDERLGVPAIAAVRNGRIARARTYAHLQADLFRALNLSPTESLQRPISKALTLEAAIWSPACFLLGDSELKTLVAWVDDPYIPVASLRDALGDGFVDYAAGRRAFSLRMYPEAVRSFRAAQGGAQNTKLAELARLMEARSLFWGATVRDTTPVSFPHDDSNRILWRDAISRLIEIANKLSIDSYRDDVDYYIVHLL